MKKAIFVVVFVFCLLSISNGYEKLSQNSNSLFITRDFQVKEFNLMEAFNFWTNTNSSWFIEPVAESCSTSHPRYGSCSVTCDKGKARCEPGYTQVVEVNSYGAPKRIEDHPPKCYCQ